MDIRPPYGYQEIVPLTTAHRVVLPKERTLPPPFRNLAALPISLTEFAAAACDYPIAFISGDGGRSFVAMAVFGLENQQNLFVFPDASWDRLAYVPAYVRRYPFCMTRVTVSGQEQPERIACVEKGALSERGEKLYDGKGEPLPVWEERRKLLFEFEADLARTDEMCRTLGGLALFEAFTMQAIPKQGAPLALSGLYRVSEQKLNALPADKLKEFAQAGVLARIYAHLISLNNFARLLDRRTALASTGANLAANRGNSG
jgi:hypothetical protein